MADKNNINKTGELIYYIIIGNSAAGLAAAESIRELDRKGKILMLTEESYKNYSKPLITYFLEGRTGFNRINFKDKNFYRDNNITLWLNKKVISVDAKKNFLTCSDGTGYKFGKLLIASGGRPIIPEIETVFTEKNCSSRVEKDSLFSSVSEKNYRDIKGIFTLTTLGDALEIKDYIEKNNIKEVSILGGGLIGLKAAEVFLEIGIEINIIELADRVLSATFDRQASDIIESKIKKRGSNIYRNNTIKKIYITNGRISGYSLMDGRKKECSLLIIAIGVRPNTEFIKGSLIKIKKGIVVDDYMHTSVKNIYAAGDVAEARDMLLDESRNIAIWPLAVRQGLVAGSNMAGSSRKYDGGFFMNSVEILDMPTVSMGLGGISEEDNKNIEIFRSCNQKENKYKKVVIRDNKIIGLIMVGNIERAGIYAGLIKNEIDISSVKGNISREDFGIINLPADYRKHLVVGEGIEV